MGLLERLNPQHCYFGHAGCSAHPETMPGLDAHPPAGICGACGAVTARLWFVPRDRKYECRACLRAVMKRATWPFVIQFEEEA